MMNFIIIAYFERNAKIQNNQSIFPLFVAVFSNKIRFLCVINIYSVSCGKIDLIDF